MVLTGGESNVQNRASNTMHKLNLKSIDLKFLAEENGKPCHKHLLNGQEVPGCSSIASMFDRGDWKMPWAAKMMYEYCKKQFQIWDRGEAPDNCLDLDAIIENGKTAWREKRDKTADTGTLLHKHLEVYIKERISGRAPAEAAPALISEAKDFALGVIQFLDWEKTNEIEWLASELQVGSETHMYAGILDTVYRMGGKIYSDDIKTSEKTKTEWVQQLVGIKAALAEMGQPIDGLGILHFPRGGGFQRVPIECDFDKEFRAFLVAKDFYRERNLFEARHPTNWRGKK